MDKHPKFMWRNVLPLNIVKIWVHQCHNLRTPLFRPILPARLAVPPPAGRHQPHQESEGEGQGGELQRQVETQEEEPITQLRVSEAPPSAPVPRVDVGAGARDLHSPLLLGEWRPAARPECWYQTATMGKNTFVCCYHPVKLTTMQRTLLQNCLYYQT